MSTAVSTVFASGYAGSPVTAPDSACAPLPAPRSQAAAIPSAGALAAWAARIEADGIAAHEDLASRLVAAASQIGLCPVLVDVLADRREPAVARERAFGRLALALALALPPSGLGV